MAKNKLVLEKDEKKSIIIALIVSAVVILAFVLAFVAVKKHGNKANQVVVQQSEESSEVQYTESGAIIVKTQDELNLALADTEVHAIMLQTEEEISIIVAEGDYSDKSIIVDVPYGEITNYGKFSSITIMQIASSTWTEGGSGNDIEILANASHIVVPSGYQVNSIRNETAGSTLAIECGGQIGELYLDATNSITSLKIDGGVSNIYLNGMTNLNISGSRTLTTYIEAYSGASESSIVSEIPIDVTTHCDILLTMNPGAEYSELTIYDKQSTVKVTNDSDDVVTIHTADGEDKDVPVGEVEYIEGSVETYESSDSSSHSSYSSSGSSTTSSSSSSSSSNTSSTSSSSNKTSTSSTTTTSTTSTQVTGTPVITTTTTTSSTSSEDKKLIESLKSQVDKLNTQISTLKKENSDEEIKKKVNTIVESTLTKKMVKDFDYDRTIYAKSFTEFKAKLPAKVYGFVTDENDRDTDVHTEAQFTVNWDTSSYVQGISGRGVYFFEGIVEAAEGYYYIGNNKIGIKAYIGDDLAVPNNWYEAADASISEPDKLVRVEAYASGYTTDSAGRTQLKGDSYFVLKALNSDNKQYLVSLDWYCIDAVNGCIVNEGRTDTVALCQDDVRIVQVPSAGQAFDYIVAKVSVAPSSEGSYAQRFVKATVSTDNYTDANGSTLSAAKLTILNEKFESGEGGANVGPPLTEVKVQVLCLEKQAGKPTYATGLFTYITMTKKVDSEDSAIVTFNSINEAKNYYAIINAGANSDFIATVDFGGHLYRQ